jgi:Mce-associated membrane protein
LNDILRISGQVVTTRASWRPGPLLAVSIALVIIAAACAGWFGWSWYNAEHSGSAAGARVRDEVLREGQQAVQNFNTLDYRHLDQGLNLWEESSTGTLHGQIAAGRAQFEQQIRKAKTISTATILDAALTSLNQPARTARIIVALQITVRPQTGPSTTKQSRLAGTLQRTPSGWKLASLGQVPVGTTAPSPGPSPSG